MKLGLLTALIGRIACMELSYANVGVFLFGPAKPDAMALTCLLALAAVMGALPGLVLARVARQAGRKDDDDSN
jgi:hypothetical protein